MRVSPALPLLLLLPACAIRDTYDPVIAVDATLRRAATATTPARVTAPDAVTAQLLHSAFANFEQQRRVAIANLTNVGTWAYKRQVVRASTRDVADADGTVFQVPYVQRIESVWSPGVLEVTERHLDLAIDGDGLFAVRLADGSVGYTRGGSFTLDVKGRIATGDGRPLLPEITVPVDVLEISIDPEGACYGRTAHCPDTTTSFGRITIHRFADPASLVSAGSNAWCATEASGRPTSGSPGTNGLGLVKQGFLERSNVQQHEELLNLQVLERQHEAFAAVMRQFGMLAP